MSPSPPPGPPASVDAGPASVAALVVRAQGGDAAAFADLHARFVGLVHTILLARVAARDAEDLVQDVFVQALHRLGSLREPAAFPGWIRQIARNRATDHHRRTRTSQALPEALPGRVRRDAEVREVLTAIRTLPDAYRETLLLRLVEGMTGPEIAERTGLTHGSVRVNLHRGMRRLREALGAEEAHV